MKFGLKASQGNKKKNQSSNGHLFGVRERSTVWMVKKQGPLCNVYSAVSFHLRGENVLFYYTSCAGRPVIAIQGKKKSKLKSDDEMNI